MYLVHGNYNCNLTNSNANLLRRLPATMARQQRKSLLVEIPTSAPLVRRKTHEIRGCLPMAHAQLGEHGRKEEKGPIHLWLDRHTARVSLLDVRLRGQPLLVFDETETAILGTYPNNASWNYDTFATFLQSQSI